MEKFNFESPYWYEDNSQELPGWDFNREIIEPGKNALFPHGVVGIRVDGDFWQVAALPYSWRIYSIQEIVEKLWPDIYHEAEFHPDT